MSVKLWLVCVGGPCKYLVHCKSHVYCSCICAYLYYLLSWYVLCILYVYIVYVVHVIVTSEDSFVQCGLKSGLTLHLEEPTIPATHLALTFLGYLEHQGAATSLLNLTAVLASSW